MRPSPRTARRRLRAPLLATPLLATLAVALAVALAACSATPDTTPRPTAVAPGGGPADVATGVTISGTGFFPRAIQLASGGLASLDTTQRAWLDGQELAGVTWVDVRTLRATIPAGLALGPHDLTVENALGRRGTLAGAWTVIVPAALSATASLSRSVASTGQPLSLAVTLRNTGGTLVQGVQVGVTALGAGGVTIGAPPAPVELGPGGAVDLAVPLLADAAGDVTFAVEARGVEAVSGRALTAPASAGPLTVQARATLAAVLELPSTVATGGDFVVTMTVLNLGDAAALGVAPGALALVAGSTDALASLSGPTPAAADVPGGGSATFTWSARLEAGGTLQLQGGAAGADANDLAPVVAAPAISNVLSQRLEVAPVATDPLGDGTAVAALSTRGGRLYVGPSADGRSFWRLDPATGQGTVLGVQIAVDAGPSPADNQAWLAAPPASTFGAAGCANNTTACGPSDEGGLGVLTAGRFSGSEWLLYASASTLKARYLYLAAQEAAPLSFQAVDLAAVLPVTAVTPTALAFVPGATAGADRIYAAFTDQADHKSPYLVALATAPLDPWLDAASPGDAVELGLATMPALQGGTAASGAPRLDALAAFQGALYLGGGAGVVRSTVPVPRSYASHPEDWAVATPSAWDEKSSVAGQAVPALVPFGACGPGPCLFLARNVVGTAPAIGPQLWRCDPTQGGADDTCQPADWALAAPNQSGDRLLTQLGVATHGAASVLVATPRYLYLGLDDAATGAQLYRAEVAPTRIFDFKGRDGCAAGTAACQGLGGAGFGDPALTRFLDARAVTTGGRTTLYVVAGDGARPLRLFAIPE